MTDFSARVNGLLGGSLPWSFGFFLTGPQTEAAMASQFNTAVTALFTTATNGLQNLITSDISLNNTVVATLNATQHEVTKTTTTNFVAGTATGNSLPWSDSVVISLRAVSIAKHARGRVFLPPFAESTVASHVVTPATVTSLKAVLDVFFPAIVAGGASLYTYNKRPLKDGTAAFSKSFMTTYLISNKPGHQRRRVSKVVPSYTAGNV
jgi:hypothetical protein